LRTATRSEGQDPTKTLYTTQNESCAGDSQRYHKSSLHVYNPFPLVSQPASADHWTSTTTLPNRTQNHFTVCDRVSDIASKHPNEIMSTPLYNWTVTEFVYPSTLPTSINLTTDNAAGASPVIAHIQPVPSGAISLGPNNVTIPVNKDTPWENYIWFLAPVAPPHISWRRNDASPIAPSSSGTTSTPSLASTTVTSSAENIPNPKVASTLPPTSSPTAKPGKQTSTVPSGAAAGAAIGCLIAGAVIAALVLWFCWGRRKRSRAQNSDASGTALVHHEKGFSSSAIPLESRSPAALSTLDTYPMPLEDKAITGEISKISNSIKNHVQSFYHASEISPGLLDIDDVKALGSDLPVPAATLGSLLDNRANREIALRFCVAWVVFSKMRPDASPSTSLLPTEVAECLRKMVDPGRGSGGRSTMLLS
jgi:hypothetical protein